MTVVDPKFLLLEIGVEMLHADLVERTNDGALEQAPDVLNAVGVDVAYGPLSGGVVDRLVLGVGVRNAHVGAEFIGIERLGFVLGDGLHKGVNGFLADVGDVTEPNLAPTLKRTSDPDPLTGGNTHRLPPMPTKAFAGGQHRLVQFDDAEQGRAGVKGLHRFPDAVAEMPRGLVGGAKGPTELVRAHGLLALDHEVRASEPLPQRKLGVVEDGARGDGEAAPAVVAVELVPGGDAGDGHRRALGADRVAVEPAELFQVVPAHVIGVEAVNHVDQVRGLLPVLVLELTNVGLVDGVRSGHG